MENNNNPGLINRHDRRRYKALERRRAKQTRRQQPRLRTALLASAAVGVLATANLSEAKAQVVLNPPGTIPAQCSIFGGGAVAVCEGDLSAGLDADGPALTTLTVQNLAGAITPATGVIGIDFDITGNGNPVLTVDTGQFGITTQGGGTPGIEVSVTGDGNVTVNSTANITTTGAAAEAILARVNQDGNVTVTADGQITVQGFDADGIDAVVGRDGDIVINALGPILAPGSIAEAILALVSRDGNITVTANGAIISDGDGIDVEVNRNGNVVVQANEAISTQSDNSEAISSRIGGTGNITITANAPITTMGNNSEAIEAIISGNGNINITSAGDITTTGNTAHGIYANEAGNGSVTINVTGNISVSGETTDGIYANENGIGDIFVTVDGNITNASPTPGGASNVIELNERDDGSIVVNTSGDMTSNDDVFDIREYGSGHVIVNSAGNLTTVFDDDELFDIDEDGSGDLRITSVGTLTSVDDAFDVSENDDGDLIIRSTGTIVAGLSGDGTGDGFDVNEFGDGDVVIVSIGDITTSGDPAGDGFDVSEDGPGGIQVTSTGNVTATGTNASGFDIGNDAPSPNVVTIIDGTITGGSGTGAGVNFDGPLTTTTGTNTLNTQGNVSLSALSGIAVNDGTADTTINNFGTLTTVSNGAIQLGGGTNAFNNMGGAIFNSGGIVNLGAGNIFSNSGIVSPGASGTIQTTAITGILVQNGGGILLSSVDPSAGTGDLVTVTQTASLAGNVQAHVINPTLGDRSVTILSAAGGTTNNGLGLLASPALQASLTFPNANDVVLNYSIDFSAGGLNPNQTALAGSLNSAVAAGTGALDPVVSALLNNVFTIGDYRNALNQLLPEVMLNNETATLFSSEDFVDNLFSCRLAGDNHTALSEGECYWARPQGRFLDRDSDTNTIGFDETSGGLAAGAQVAVAPNWFAGFALGYERASLDTDTGAETDSNRFSGGLSLKYQAGSFLFGAAISGGVSGNDTRRPISFGGVGGFNATVESNYAIKTLTGQARAAYVFQFRDWFAKPLVDVTATYLSRDGVTETGAGAANLALSGSDETFFSVTPALEIGGDFALSETSVIRPYVRAGVSFYTDSDHGLTASFVNAPAGTGAFSISSDFNDVFADVAAGATAFFDNGSTLGLAYEGLISSDTQQHGLSLKGTIAF